MHNNNQELLLLVLLLFSAALLSGGITIPPEVTLPRQCLRLTVADLGRTDILSSEGIVSEANDGVPVQIIRYNILCLSSSNVRDRYQSVSVLVGYSCPSCPASSGTMDEIVEQFTFDCDDLGNLTYRWPDSNTLLRSVPMSVGFDTPEERSCGLCEHPNRTTATTRDYDPNTHCLRCNVECTDAPDFEPPRSGLCYQQLPARMNSEVCCEVFENGICTDLCMPSEIQFRVPDPVTFECSDPTFRVNGGDPLPLFPPINQALYVHVNASTPVSIRCFYGPRSRWTLLGVSQMTLEPGRTTLEDGSEVAVGEGFEILRISPAPLSVLTFQCSYMGESNDIVIIVVPENPYLTLTDINGEDTVVISEGAEVIQIFTSSAFSPDGGITHNFTPSSALTVTITPENGVAVPASILAVSSGTFVLLWDIQVFFGPPGPNSLNLVDPRATVSVELDVAAVDGSRLRTSRSLQVIRETLSSVPAISLVDEGEPFNFTCTPTTSTNVTYTTGTLGTLDDVDGVIINRTNITHATQYSCSAYGNTITRETFLIVFPADSSGLEVFSIPALFAIPQTNNTILGPRSRISVDTWFTVLPPTCVGRPGHADLEFTLSPHPQLGGLNIELLAQLDAIAGMLGTHEFTVRPFDFTVTYSAVNGSATINVASLNISGLDFADETFLSRFMCLSRESGQFKHFTISSREITIFTEPFLRTTVSLGQEVRIDIFVSSSQFLRDPIHFVDNSEPNLPDVFSSDLDRFQMEADNFQHVIFTAIAVPELAGLNEFRFPFVEEGQIVVGLEVLVTVPSLTISSPTEVRESDPLEITCTPSDLNVRLFWVIEDQEVFSSNDDFQLSSPENHMLRIERTPRAETIIVTCIVQQNPNISLSTIITVIRRCPVSVYAGVTWGPAFEGNVTRRRCRAIDSRFSEFVMTSRTCLSSGWSDVDFGACTLQAGTEPFILAWFLLRPAPSDVILSEVTLMIGGDSGADVVEGSERLSASPDMPELENFEGTPGTPYLYSADLNIRGDVVDIGLLENEIFFPSFFRESSFAPFGFDELLTRIQSSDNQGVLAFRGSSICSCVREVISFGERQTSSFWPLCVDFLVSPCQCTFGDQPSCECQSPFLGTMTSCVPDSDRDGFPDLALPEADFQECANGCQDSESELFISFCCNDTCPLVYNPDQSPSACMPSADGTIECPAEVDAVYGFQWGYTSPGLTVEQPCGANFIGETMRVCSANGKWEDPNVDNCLGVAYVQVQMSSQIIADLVQTQVPFDRNVAVGLLEEVDDLALATEVSADGLSRLPMELQTSASFILNTVDYLLTGTADITLDEFLEEDANILEVLSNLVSPSNLPGSMQLLETNPENTFSQDLLNSAERYGLYLSTLLDLSNSTKSMTFMADNILVNAQSIDVNGEVQELVYPSNEELNTTNTSLSAILDRLGDARVVIPASVLLSRGALRRTGRVRVSNIFFQNVEQFLPTAANGVERNPVTLVLSSQVEEQRAVQALTDPVTLTFTATNQSSDQNFSCVFFDFDIGEFSTEGVTTELAVPQDNGDVIINCTSNHLTSFAVLVNIGGEDLTSPALSIASYVGIGISLACLLLTIIFFLSFGKELFTKGVHNFVHLNLAIALFMAYLLFAVGVETAARNQVACQVVTAFLHYLFLAVFCWMLSEGVMLYLMLVVVFSTLAKKWWFFFLLGWLPPIPFVAIGLGTVLDQYGYHINDELVYCWLASGNGQHAIWTFVAPMLAIMLINVVFLVLVMVSLVRSQRKKQAMKEGKRLDLVKNIIKASFILLPLLGLTWAFGLLIISRTAIVFAWIFTILNTLQGVLFFVLHVLRHEKIWGRFKKKYNLFQSTTSKHDHNSKAYYKKTDSTTGGGSYSLQSKSKVNSSRDSSIGSVEDTKFEPGAPTGREASDERELTKQPLEETV